MHVNKACIPQFWLVWMALCMNERLRRRGSVHSPMPGGAGGHSIVLTRAFGELDKRGQLASIAAVKIAADLPRRCFVQHWRALWCGQRIRPAGAQDHHAVFPFILGGLPYFSIPASAAAGSCALLLVGAGLHHLWSMWLQCSFFHRALPPGRPVRHTADGGRPSSRLAHGLGHGRPSGPVVVNHTHRSRSAWACRASAGVQPDHVHPRASVIGLLCNLMIRLLNAKWFMSLEVSWPTRSTRRTIMPWPTRWAAALPGRWRQHPGGRGGLAWVAVGITAGSVSGEYNRARPSRLSSPGSSNDIASA